MSPRTTALVTGASSGIGEEFARRLAGRGHDLVLVARNRDRLETLAEELRRAHGIRAEVLVADLADRAQLETVAVRLRSADEPVEVLVNNAGFGIKTGFLDTELADEEALLDVLVRAVLVLSHAAGRAMRERGHGQIVNVSSVAGWIVSGSYSAAKSWVTVFTEGLAGQLAGSGVHVMALCPGFTRTDFQPRMGEDFGHLPGLVWLDTPRLVDDALRDLDRGKVISTPSALYQAARLLTRIAPRRVLRHRLLAQNDRPSTPSR